MLALRLVPLFMPALVLSGMVVIYSSLPLYIIALLVLASIASLSYVAWNYESYIQTVKQQKKQIEHLSALQESQLESYHSLEPLFIESLPVWARHIDSANQHLTDSVSELSQQFSQLVERLSHTLSLTGVNSHGKEQSVTEEIHQCRSMLNNAVDALRAGQTLRQQVLSEMRELMKYTTSLKKMAGEVVGIADKTNLLALNAAIESARAGEAGRGFAVVADEVRGLSQQSRETASKMTEQVNSVNAAIEKACEMVEQVNKDETEQMNNTEQCIDEVINHFQHIVQTLDEQAQGLTEDAQQVKETVTHVIIRLQFQDRVSQILEQITRNLTELGDAITLVQQDRNHPIVGQLSPQKWLDKMKSSYTMIEQHQVHTGKKSTHSSKPEVQSDITFF
ncbi:methyl-accepting chemotaxis protein [Vibrio metschnikovii]|uniref:methyl-accepting chemotaxis protein n=1 Tax=Vibrio metschnikovii TaxID=28172 RepID=UPI001C2FE4E4|nr:methyl-accepting chemotaxis protein [Vibrio metschnikovii]